MHTQTRLTRSTDNKVIGGVCGGLAQYFNIDPVIVRLIFVALVFAGGMSILLYPVLWLIMPASETAQPAMTWQVMQQVGQQIRTRVRAGKHASRSSLEDAFAGSGAQARFDPQTGQPLPYVATNRNRTLGIVLLGIGVIMLANLFPGGSSIALALMLLGGGIYLLRRT